jgi:hypothetical protein
VPAARGCVALLLVLVLAAFLRLISIDAGWFGADQARDLTWAGSIAAGDELPRVGPLMRGRAHLGATYYYFWAVPALFGNDPRLAYAFAALLGVAAVAGCSVLAARIGGRTAGVLAALLLATDPAAVIDSRVAWAPAVLPPVTAAVLLLCHALLRKPTVARAAATAATATLATQLHLAAAPLVLVATGSALARGRALGARGLVVTALAALIPLVPMAVAWRLDAGSGGAIAGDVRAARRESGEIATSTSPGESAASASRSTAPVAASSTATRPPTEGRIGDLLLVSGRTVEGYLPPRDERAALLTAWALCERLALSIALVGAVLVALRMLGGSPFPTSPLPELLAFALAIGAVVLLPAEAWYYYLDGALVPGCVLLALAASAPGKPAVVLRFVLIAAVTLRVTGLLVWLQTGPATGLVRANLEWLRVGGSDEEQLAGRARLPTLAIKQAAARAIVGDLGIPADRVRSRVHGAGFGDLDTDNGFFFARAAQGGVSTASPRPQTPPLHALVAYPEELPESWLDRFAPPLRVGPLAIYRYSPSVDTESARIRDCGDAPLPSSQLVDPREYGFGLPELPAWPCSPGDLELEVPIAAAPPGTVVRVVARVQGAARVVSLESAPAGIPIATTPPGSSMGLELPAAATRLSVQLQVDGPAALDLYELHGADRAAH